MAGRLTAPQQKMLDDVVPSLADFAELTSLAGDRGLLMNPPDQWAEPPDSGPILSAELAAAQVTAIIAAEVAAKKKAHDRAVKAAAERRWRGARIRWRARAE